jgi:hypothetical protein
MSKPLYDSKDFEELLFCRTRIYPNLQSATMRRNLNNKEKNRLRIKRAWDSGIIHQKISLRDRTEDDSIREKLDRKGAFLFSIR